jgi:general secretion pathway protein E
MELDALEVSGGDEDAGSDLSRDDVEDAPIVRFINKIMLDAIRRGASDIHFEPYEKIFRVRLRMDGVLKEVAQPPVQLANKISARLKVMSRLDIAERRVPQDGRIKLNISKTKAIDFRVSTCPTLFGEKIVLRVLDASAAKLGIEKLGYEEEQKKLFLEAIAKPYGMVLVTGPTGSGKTTTLYAMISEINRGHDKIITIEDPVEYQLPGVLQIPVNEKKGLTFARGLRSILRHDPDKIMVGEIRDTETAQIAVQSALTGHLVFTTVHANNVFDVISRIVQMNVDTYSFVSACNAILAQRLVRVVCPHCAREARPSPELLAESHLDSLGIDEFHFVEGVGCGRCRGTGFKGRLAIAELVLLDDEIRQHLVEKEPIIRIKERARAKGLRFLRDSAVDLVRTGRTSLQEINRVTFVS